MPTRNTRQLPGLFSRNDLADNFISAEAEVLDFLFRLFLGGGRSRGGNAGDLVRVGANFLRALGGGEGQGDVELGGRNDALQDPRVLSFGEEISRRNQIQNTLQINPSQLAGLSRLFSGFLNILR